MASKNKSDVKKGAASSNQPPQWTEYLCCSVCEKDFNRTDRCPISLGCGHTLCKACLGKLKQPQCHYDQIPITCNINDLPTNSALLQLLPGDSDKSPTSSHSIVHITQKTSHDTTTVNFSQCLKNYDNAKTCIEELALYLKPGKSSDLSRPMQRKLVALINCQLFEDEGRKRALRACRALGERTATELILLHQNPTTLSSNLWAAVRARGCQFLGPAMQEEALKIIHLALEDGSELSRKVLVQIVVKNLQTQFSQASKTSIGHVVQLLYRASCFIVTKRDGESSLMRLKDEFLQYDDLRKEHDSQIVQIAREAGLRIAPDQWSAILYGDQVHKSHMQSIIDRLQSGASFLQCITDLSLALQRSNDPGNMRNLLLHFKLLSDLDTENPSWDTLDKGTYSAKLCVTELVDFMKQHHHWLWQCQDATQQTSKYKTSMCRDSKNKGICPRGQSCTFAHSDAELQHYRNRRKKGGQIPFSSDEFMGESNENDHPHMGNNVTCSTEQSQHKNCNPERSLLKIAPQQGHICHCGNALNQPYNGESSVYYREHIPTGKPTIHPAPHNVLNSTPVQPNVHQTLPMPIAQQISPLMATPNMAQQQPSQVHYVTGNHVVYESKGPGLERVHIVPNTHTQFNPGMPVAVEVQNSVPKHMQNPMVQPSQYLIHKQQNPSYCQLPPNQVHPPAPEPLLSSLPQSGFHGHPPSYACLTLQTGHQFAVPPPPRPEMIQQSPVMYQQQALHIQNMSPTQSLNYAPGMIMQTPQAPLPGPPPIQNMMSSPVITPSPPKPNENIVATAMVSPEEMPVMSNTQSDRCHVVMPSIANNLASLAELRQRKEQVINKLVKKRIVAPKIEDNLQQKLGLFCDVPVDEKSGNASGDKLQFFQNEYLKVACSGTTPVIGASSNVKLQEKSFDMVKAPDSHYSLWAGTTCIPSLNNLPLHDEFLSQSPINCVVDVISDLDCNTYHVPSMQDDGKFAQSRFKMHSFPLSTEDDIVPIQDLRIVSKYGPIARTVRSKTTSSIPEQVTANANSATHPFLSDKNLNKSDFVALEQSNSCQNLMFIRSEVEPTAVSVSSKKLPDVVCNNYSFTPVQSNATYSQDMSQVLVPNDENEDLLLAIELQQIEMNIQQIQRDSRSK